ncbi:hypothetical protein ANRL3_01269 [Anaerolineae bacterium]|nr:hypothetical protein ANRL3_01269 [Anaerolineae bacterium]
MTDAPNLMDTYLSELRAKSKSASAEEMFQRLAIEKQIQDVLLRLSGDFGFRFIEDRRVNPDQLGSDFVLQFENYEARIEIKYTNSTKLILGKDDIERYCSLLEKNDLTDAIIVVWTMEGLMATTLTLPQIKYLQENPHRVNTILESAKPLDETIKRFVNSQTPLWSLPSEATSKAQIIDTTSIFAKELESAIQDEAKRKFHIPEKQTAARMLGQREVRQFVSLLQRTISGADIKELEHQLLAIFRVKE